MEFKKNNLVNLLFFIILYLSLIVGFLFNENLNLGSYYDWVKVYIPVISDFSENFSKTLLNYDQYGQRHSPIYLIFLSILLDSGFSFEGIRIIHLHLCLSLIFIFYHCLKLVFDNIKVQSLQLLSFIIFLSPTFRSLSIWPDSRLPGLVFFVLAIYFFLKFMKNGDLKYMWLNSISLIVSSYISPNFSLFAIYFYFFFIKNVSIKNLIPLFIFNFVVSIPIFYYLFVLKIFFLTAGKTVGLNGDYIGLSFNFADKIMIISSIILFHLLPVLLTINFHHNYVNFFKKYFIRFFLIYLALVYFFNYQIEFTGGGFFFQLSHMLFDNNYLFFGICLFSIAFLFYFSKVSINNFFLFSLIIISNLQNSIYHKYYEPMILIIFFTLFKNINLELFFKNKNNIIYLYIFSLGYIFLRLFKNNFLV